MRRDDDWNHFSYTYDDGKHARVEFDVACAMFTPDSHQCCVRVRCTVPDALEAALASTDERVWLVGRMHYAGGTTLVLQCESHTLIDACLPADVEVERSEGWDFFDSRVCPTEVDWRRIADREQLEQLVARGLDPIEPRAFVHCFYGSERGIAAVRQRLESEGLTVVACSGDRLEVARTHEPRAISETSVPLARFARTVGVAYDGWRIADPW